MAVTISEASPDDLPALTEINRLAYYREAVVQFAFKNWPDEKNMFEVFKMRLGERFASPSTQIFKATDVDTDKPVGFVCWTLEAGDEETPGFKTIPGSSSSSSVDPSAKVVQQMPPFLNLEFAVSTGAQIEQMKKHMTGSKHYYLSAFAVEPSLQGQGIGTKLLEHCLLMADQAALRTWLISFPGSRSLYLRSGFKDVDHRDIDLGAWDKGRLRGFGIYRQHAMVREPREN